MDGFEWSSSVPYVPVEPGENGWCLRDAVCELFGWRPGSPEWFRFIEGPQGRDTPRLARHLGLTVFEIPPDWNDLLKRTAHPGIALFVFPAYRMSHAVYVYNVAALIHHWPRALGSPATASERWLFHYGWPLGSQYLRRRPELEVVLVDERRPAHDA